MNSTTRQPFLHLRRPHRVELLPENAEFEPIVVDLREQNLVIEGLGVGVLRNGPESFRPQGLRRR